MQARCTKSTVQRPWRGGRGRKQTVEVIYIQQYNRHRITLLQCQKTRQQSREFKTYPVIHFQGHCSLNSRAAFLTEEAELEQTPQREITQVFQKEETEVGCGVSIYPFAVFAGVAVVWVDSCPWRHREQHFYAALCPEERRSGEPRQSADVSQGNTGRNSASAWSRSSQRSDVLHTQHWLYACVVYPTLSLGFLASSSTTK